MSKQNLIVGVLLVFNLILGAATLTSYQKLEYHEQEINSLVYKINEKGYDAAQEINTLRSTIGELESRIGELENRTDELEDKNMRLKNQVYELEMKHLYNW